MLGRVDADAAEANREEIDDVGRDAVLRVRLLGIQVEESDEVAFCDLVHVGPGADAALAVKIGGTVWNGWELVRWSCSSLRVDQVGVARGVVW